MATPINRPTKLMRVGELAKAVGKTVRAMHLYEELGLLEPRPRSEGGFRLYGAEAIDRIHWIVKLQAIGFTLAEIQGFVQRLPATPARAARRPTRVRALFTEKQAQIREQITQLAGDRERPHRGASRTSIPARPAPTTTRRTECGVCDHHGHQQGRGTAAVRRPVARPSAPDAAKDFDVPCP